MAVPIILSNLSLFQIAKELELNDYHNTIPPSTYQQYYATPISLTNMSTGAGGFDPINTNNSITVRPDGAVPHAMSEFAGYDHDYSPGTTPQVSTSLCRWSCKVLPGDFLLNGSVNTSTSGHATTEYGFVYSTFSTNPIIGGAGVTKVVVGTSNYNGMYSYSTSNVMVPCCCGSIDYYVKAYAINSVGTAYGNTVTVTVTDCYCGGGDGPDGPGGPI